MSATSVVAGMECPAAEQWEAFDRLFEAAERLKDAFEYEAQVIEAHLSLKTFPKSRRRFAEAQVLRLRLLAVGGWPQHYVEHPRSIASAHRDRTTASEAP